MARASTLAAQGMRVKILHTGIWQGRIFYVQANGWSCAKQLRSRRLRTQAKNEIPQKTQTCSSSLFSPGAPRVVVQMEMLCVVVEAEVEVESAAELSSTSRGAWRPSSCGAASCVRVPVSDKTQEAERGCVALNLVSGGWNIQRPWRANR